MTLKICDRCGKDVGYNQLSFDPLVGPKIIKVEKIFDFKNPVAIDLCADCQRDLLSFINNYDKEGKE